MLHLQLKFDILVVVEDAEIVEVVDSVKVNNFYLYSFIAFFQHFLHFANKKIERFQGM